MRRKLIILGILSGVVGFCGCGDEQADGDLTRCGNGHLDEGEACDDGNREGGDGCAWDCSSVEEGYACPTAGAACVAESRCGNGHLDEGEACDDGNREGGDGCAWDCSSVEEGYTCSQPGYGCVPKTCGDGVVDKNEACDAGPFNVEYGKEACSWTCQPAHYCGDGLLDLVDRGYGEVCDLGSQNGVVAYNGCTSDCQRMDYCGDGKVSDPYETCDDANSVNGDGCSETCQIEPGFVCVAKNGKSECHQISCGNGILEPVLGEACDDGNRVGGDGCSQNCQVEKSWRCDIGEDGTSQCVQTCGDGVIQLETGEMCDDGNTDDGDGCSSRCAIESGYVCSMPGKPCIARLCGDGIMAGSETCDDGNQVSGDGCSSKCQREPGYVCKVSGMPCELTVCGDGIVNGDETCDEGLEKTEGCRDCQIVMGWQCLTSGMACTHDAEFGNGILEGAEACDDGRLIHPENITDGCIDGRVTPGWRCPIPGEKCIRGTCGDGFLDEGEACDDGNLVAGDGCSPICTKEPIFECIGGACHPICGDGIVVFDDDGNPLEECDDGNLVNGDGCSSDCRIESGYQCTQADPNEQPEVLNVSVTYRDFRAYHPQYGDNQDHGYPTIHTAPGYFTEADISALPASCTEPAIILANGYRKRHYPKAGTPIPDFQGNSCYGQNLCTNVVYPDLGEIGRPRLRPAGEITTSPDAVNFDTYETCAQLYTCPEIFDYWYKDSDMSIKIVQKLQLKRIGDKQYQFSSNRFFPLTNLGFNATNATEKYGVWEQKPGLFTSEYESYFKYRGGESFTFSGDDDVWVYFNGKLAIELAGIHGDKSKTIVFTPEKAKDFNMYPGGIYPMKMFHAERCNGGSTYTLTLNGFVNMSSSECASVCGDGIVRGTEQCDPVVFKEPSHPTAEELELAKKAGCVDCVAVPYCGNGVIEAGEQCDTHEDWCVQCRLQPQTCGNGVVDAHEQCDCTEDKCYKDAEKTQEVQCNRATCRMMGCGNGIVEEGEACDDGNSVNDDACTNACTLPKCGDNIVQSWLGEVCDDGVNDGTYGGCGFDCSYMPPRCGDGVVDEKYGETCDDGINDGSYGSCNRDCSSAPHCGDGILQPEYEQCDEGALNGKGKCAETCIFSVN